MQLTFFKNRILIADNIRSIRVVKIYEKVIFVFIEFEINNAQIYSTSL